MICHHPDDALLLQLAAGTLKAGPAVVVTAHLERCGLCRLKHRELDALGGVLLEQLEPHALTSHSLMRLLKRIDSPPARSEAAPVVADWSRIRATVPPGARWPRSLQAASTTPWRRLTFGVRWCRVSLPRDPEANVFLVRVSPGKGLPVHSHKGGELTHVLHGAFHDGKDRYASGDFEEADGSTHHRPIASEEGECVCLTAVDGRMSFDGPMARAMGRLLKI